MKKMECVTKLLVTTAIVTMAGFVNAATMIVDESTLPGGDFSGTQTPTVLTSGVDGVTGMLIPVDNDLFSLVGLPTGVQTFDYSLTITDLGPGLTSFFISYGEDGESVLSNFLGTPSTDVSGSFMTTANFNGTLTVNFAMGVQGLDKGSYSVALQTAPVPVPAAGGLLISCLGLLGAGCFRHKEKSVMAST